MREREEPKGFVSWAAAKDRKTYKGCPVAPDRVKVYFNLQKDCLSVIDAETGLLYCHSHRVELHNAKFRVQEAGRQRVIREKRKNVHAYITGNWHNEGEVSKVRFRKRGDKLVEQYRICECDEKDYCEVCVPESGDSFTFAQYNPYKYKTFIGGIDMEPLFSSPRVVVRDKTAVGPLFNIFYVPEVKKKK